MCIAIVLLLNRGDRLISARDKLDSPKSEVKLDQSHQTSLRIVERRFAWQVPVPALMLRSIGQTTTRVNAWEIDQFNLARIQNSIECILYSCVYIKSKVDSLTSVQHWTHKKVNKDFFGIWVSDSIEPQLCANQIETLTSPPPRAYLGNLLV